MEIRGRSSTGQSIGLSIRRLRVRVPSGIRNEDINIDGFINELDLWYIGEYWLQPNPPYGDLVEDNFMDFLDFVRLAEVWLIEEY